MRAALPGKHIMPLEQQQDEHMLCIIDVVVDVCIGM